MTPEPHDYTCAECGAQAVTWNARIYVNHDDTCDLLHWLRDNTNLIHLQRTADDEYRGGPWDGN
jgi:hypothetical protein